MKLNLIALSIMLSGSLSAAELYNPSQNYPAGEQVSFNGNIYETQWWANPGQSPAGITENSWDSPWVWVSEESDDVTPPVGDIVTTYFEYFERGLTLNGDMLGISGLTISAVERYQDRLYVTHDITPGVVLILDAKTGSMLGQIEGIQQGSDISIYRRINELHIDNNLLYVASLSSNRVDIFDLDNNHQHVMSLGTGHHSGTNSLLHAQAVTTTRDYVVVSDASDKIKVYRQQDATPENNLRAPQFATLQFEGKYTHRKVQMHVLDHYLLVQSENKNYYIYDLYKVESAAAAGVPLQAEQRLDVKLQKIDKDGEQLIVNRNGRLEWHKVSDVIANQFQFTNPIRTMSQLNGAPVGNLNDLHFAHDELISAAAGHIRFDALRTNAVTFTPNAYVETTKLKFDELAPFSIGDILSLDEPHHILTNPSLRSVKINSPVKTVLLDKDTVQVTSYAAVELTDINLELKLEGVDHWVVLANLDRIPAYAQFTLPLSSFGTGQFNTSDDTGLLDLESVFSSSMEYANLFDYRFNSKTDAFAQKLASMKPTWNVQFATQKDGKWRAMNGLYAREWLIILTNLAYMVSEEEFNHVWFNFKHIFGYNMHGKAGAVEGPQGFFSEEDYQHWYDALMARPRVNAGITAMGGGLGSASVTGVDTWMFYTHYYGTWGIIAHEFGHGFDGHSLFGHHTSFANGGNGWQPLITQLANYHIRKGDLPYMDDNINGFYKPEHAPYHYSGIEAGKRKHRDPNHMYTLENYFMSQSDMPQGWLQNGLEMSTSAVENLNFLERNYVVNYPMGEQKPYLCRFTFEDGEQYFGFVAEQGDSARCEAGSSISYRRPDGSKVPLQSELNTFEWLSIYNPEMSGEPVMHSNGQPLCQVNKAEFYGTGFVNDRGQCTQLPNVYWSNGKHWTFSSGWAPLKYSGGWTSPTLGRALPDVESEHDHENCGLDH